MKAYALALFVSLFVFCVVVGVRLTRAYRDLAAMTEQRNQLQFDLTEQRAYTQRLVAYSTETITDLQSKLAIVKPCAPAKVDVGHQTPIFSEDSRTSGVKR